MSGGGQQPVTTQTQTNTPWATVAGGYNQTIPTAEFLQQNSIGYQPYTGATQAPLDVNTAQALANVNGVASWQDAYNPATHAQALGNTVMDTQGITPGIQNALGGLGAAGAQYAGLIANAYAPGNAYSTAINNMGQQNPYLQQALQQTIGNQLNSSFAGAGRYGSGAQQEAIAAGESPALAQDWATRQQLGLGAQQAQAQQALQATQGFGGTNQAMAGIYQTGLGQAGQMAQLMPQEMQAQYIPSQERAGVGQFLQGRAQQDLNAQIQLYNAQQSYPWEQLARENAIIGGAGGLGGSSISSSTTSVPLGQRILGGGLAGAGLGSAFGPIGSGLGAAAGGLAGGFL